MHADSRTVIASILAAVALSSAPLLAHAAAPFDQNLIVNGDAEASAGSNAGSAAASVPGFTIGGTFSVTTYGASGGFPTASDPGPASRGLNFFAGGPSAGVSTAEQFVDVSSGASFIDLGSTTFDLSAYLGGFSSQRDNATLQISFLDGASAVLGTASLGPVSPADRGSLTGLLARSTTGIVPVGTRSVDILLTLTRVDGSYNDGYADNLSLVMHAVPEPTTIALALAGLGVIGVARRRQNR